MPDKTRKVQVQISTRDPVVQPDPVLAATGDVIEWHVTQGSAEIVFTASNVVTMRKTLAKPDDPATGVVVAKKVGDQHGYKVWAPRAPGAPPPGGAEDKCTIATLIIAPP